MLKDEYKYYYVYKITCICEEPEWDGKYYIGQHHTDFLNDGYAGSGSRIRRYFDMFGKVEGRTYTKDILQFCTSSTETNLVEAQFINAHLSDENCLNISAGQVNELGELNDTTYRIYKYNLDGEFIREYKSMKEFKIYELKDFNINEHPEKDFFFQDGFYYQWECI